MENFWQQLGTPVLNDTSVSEDRLIMLCDGEHAIAITLLVLDIRLPDDATHFQENLPAIFLKMRPIVLCE